MTGDSEGDSEGASEGESERGSESEGDETDDMDEGTVGGHIHSRSRDNEDRCESESETEVGNVARNHVFPPALPKPLATTSSVIPHADALESFSQVSSVDDRHQKECATTPSLGRMVPVDRKWLSVQEEHLKKYNIVVHSRDRDLMGERCFEFALEFGKVDRTLTHHLKTTSSRSVSNVPEEEVHILGVANGQSITNKNVHTRRFRRCTVDRKLKEVSQITMNSIRVPVATFPSSHPFLPVHSESEETVSTTTTSSSASAELAVPGELMVQLDPLPSRMSARHEPCEQCKSQCVLP